MSIFQRIQSQRDLSRLQRQRTQVSTDYERELKKLQKSGKSEEEASLDAASMFKADIRATHTNVVVFQSDRLIEEAERLQVIIPDDDKYWTMLKYAAHRHLSEEGQSVLRTRIRAERTARREVVGFWFNIITVILSLLVAIIALTK